MRMSIHNIKGVKLTAIEELPTPEGPKWVCSLILTTGKGEKFELDLFSPNAGALEVGQGSRLSPAAEQVRAGAPALPAVSFGTG